LTPTVSIEELPARTDLDRDAILALLSLSDPEGIERLRLAAFDLTTRLIGDEVHYRGLVEISNICACDCCYCGIRKGNRDVERYTLSREQVVESALWSAEAGYGSCVLQAGERRDPSFVALIEECVREIKERSVSDALPEGIGITLSLGEQSPKTYERWRAAGAHRYLLRIETSNPELFTRIHPGAQRFETRMRALGDLRDAGFQVGTGVMIGLPGQTLADLADDVCFFRSRDIDMIGMGPYITAPNNAMGGRMMRRAALLSLALKMIAVTRLALRDVNIASTTALQALVPDGRERGILYGANVVMPNLTPREARKNYQLYEGKPCIEETRTECSGCLERRILSCGRRVGWNSWGDSRHYMARESERCTQHGA
jgi:biotin synthase